MNIGTLLAAFFALDGNGMPTHTVKLGKPFHNEQDKKKKIRRKIAKESRRVNRK